VLACALTKLQPTMRVVCLYSLSVVAARSHAEPTVEIPKVSATGYAHQPSLTAAQQDHTLRRERTRARGPALWVVEAVNRSSQNPARRSCARRCSCARRGTLQLRGGGGSTTTAAPGTARIARSATWIVGLGSVLAIIARPHNGVRSLDTVKLALLLVTTLAAVLQFAAGSAEQASSSSSSSKSSSEPLPAGFKQFRAAYMVVHVLCLFAEFLPTAYLYKVSHTVLLACTSVCSVCSSSTLLNVQADHMQLVCVYALHMATQTFETRGFSVAAISQLYLIGHLTALASGLCLGTAVDKVGRRAGCMLYAALQVSAHMLRYKTRQTCLTNFVLYVHWLYATAA
jgi:Sugar-tranasporters, 12 TM